MNLPDEKRVLDWIEVAEHHKRIKEMKPDYETPDHVKEMCRKLTELSRTIKHQFDEESSKIQLQ